MSFVQMALPQFTNRLLYLNIRALSTHKTVGHFVSQIVAHLVRGLHRELEPIQQLRFGTAMVRSQTLYPTELRARIETLHCQQFTASSSSISTSSFGSL